MPVDETWLAVTKLYAIVSLVSLGILILGTVYLGVRIRGLGRAAKLAPKAIGDHSNRTADLVRGSGESLMSRGRIVGAVCRSSFERIAGKLRDARDLIE